MAGADSPKVLLERYGLRPKYSFGQNFLADERLAARIAETCAARGGSVVELGAGLGALTRPLLEGGVEFVLAVERVFGEHPRVLDGSRAVQIGDVKLSLEDGERELWLVRVLPPALEDWVAGIEVGRDIEAALREARQVLRG